MEIRYYNEEIIKGKKGIYLAGPDARSNWKEYVLPKLNNFDGIIYIPKSRNRNDAPLLISGTWEADALASSSAVGLWIAGEDINTPFNISPELAENINTTKALYGRPAPISLSADNLYKPAHIQEPINNIEQFISELQTLSCQVHEIQNNQIPLGELVDNALSSVYSNLVNSTPISRHRFIRTFYETIYNSLTDLEQEMLKQELGLSSDDISGIEVNQLLNQENNEYPDNHANWLNNEICGYARVLKGNNFFTPVRK